MQIKPCPKSKNGEHQWRYDTKRKHGRNGRRFVICALCKQRAQESDNGVKFTTAREFLDPKTIVRSSRLTPAREAEILAAGYRSVNMFVNEAPVIQVQ